MAEHEGHDQELVAAAADRSGRLVGLMAACAECLTIVGDLRALAAATPSAAIPRRPRDYRLSIAQAASLRRRGWRRVLDGIGTRRDMVTRPLAMSLTTLGLVGLLLSSVPSGLPFAAGTAADEAVGQPLQTIEVLDTRGSGSVTPPVGDDGTTTAMSPVEDAGRPVRLLSLTFLGLAAGIVVLRRASSSRRGLR